MKDRALFRYREKKLFHEKKNTQIWTLVVILVFRFTSSRSRLSILFYDFYHFGCFVDGSPTSNFAKTLINFILPQLVIVRLNSFSFSIIFVCWKHIFLINRRIHLEASSFPFMDNGFLVFISLNLIFNELCFQLNN